MVYRVEVNRVTLQHIANKIGIQYIVYRVEVNRVTVQYIANKIGIQYIGSV